VGDGAGAASLGPVQHLRSGPGVLSGVRSPSPHLGDMQATLRRYTGPVVSQSTSQRGCCLGRIALRSSRCLPHQTWLTPPRPWWPAGWRDRTRWLVRAGRIRPRSGRQVQEEIRRGQEDVPQEGQAAQGIAPGHLHSELLRQAVWSRWLRWGLWRVCRAAGLRCGRGLLPAELLRSGLWPGWLWRLVWEMPARWSGLQPGCV
jgi:hypothetical protein